MAGLNIDWKDANTISKFVFSELSRNTFQVFQNTR